MKSMKNAGDECFYKVVFIFKAAVVTIKYDIDAD